MIRVAMAAAVLVASMAHADELALTLATATPGGGFAVYGEAVAESIKESDPGIRLELRGTKGSTENLPLLAQEKVDLALVEGTIVHEALRAGADQFRVVAVMYSSPGMFVVRADSPYRSIADLKGQRVAFGAPGSGLTMLGRLVLDGMGLQMERDFDAVFLESVKNGPPMVIDGTAAALWGGGVGWPGFIAVAKGPAGARFFGPAAADIPVILQKHPHLRPLEVPANSFPGQSAPIATVGTWSFILSRPGLPDESAHRFARALFGSQPALGKRLPQAVDTTAVNTAISLPRKDLLHPGVARYLKDADVLN